MVLSQRRGGEIKRGGTKNQQEDIFLNEIDGKVKELL